MVTAHRSHHLPITPALLQIWQQRAPGNDCCMFFLFEAKWSINPKHQYYRKWKAESGKVTKHVVYKSRMSHCGNEGAAFEAVDKVFFLFPTQLEHILNQKGFESAPISWVKINKKTWKRVTSIFHFWVHFTLSCVLKQTACVYIYFGKQKTAKKKHQKRHTGVTDA